ncbi:MULTISPECIES: GNAT family N-acetyltransferase [Exiguobacterium]|uniref:GNAT family N-acetyltransferase n=1 Tax=Exiguobacterium TaxID=33986 RepID=UPI001BE8709D|nr:MULTISPECIES: GNAT family N-acetyltransferase [Exiguobacterium]MCT4793747.1 GNAT family N-acetyltransferase [Exiguobacterium artemiae]
MTYAYLPLTQRQAEQIAYDWTYEGDFAFYNMPNDPDDLAEFLDPNQRTEHCYAVMDGTQLIGFFVCEPGQDSLELALGMRPDLTGWGNGAAFLENGIAFAIQKYQPHHIELAVATFNERAIRLYTKSGFEPIERFQQETNGGSYEFVKMRLYPGVMK